MRTMAQQEDGWPLGLQPVNVRIGMVRNRDFSGSISFNTLLTASESPSTDFSSDLDTESTGSFFHDKSITLGSLIGVSSILELSGRSSKGRRTESSRSKKTCKSRTWFFSLCSKVDVDTESAINPPSLGHFLEVERQAANGYDRNESPMMYDEFAEPHPVSERNALFVDGQVAPPIHSSPEFDSDTGSNGDFVHGTEYGAPIFFSCICGQPTS